MRISGAKSRSLNSGEDNLFRRQFLLTNRTGFKLPWPSVQVQEYTLYYHPEIEYSSCKDNSAELHLIGEIFDWQFPEWSNADVLRFLLDQDSVSAMLAELSRFSGHYMLICRWNEIFFVLNDACAQFGVFYDKACSTFGSQITIMNEVLEMQDNQDSLAQKFFRSSEFQKKRIFAGDKTHKEDVFHLRPNHLIDLNNRRQERFFPVHQIEPLSIEVAAEKADRMIKGFVKAVAARHPIAVAVTAGYDSRILFLASIGCNARYFICQHNNMSDSHPDIVVARQLTETFGQQLEVVKDVPTNDQWPSWEYNASIDFPRSLNQMSHEFKDCVCLNGNCSEIARNYFGSVPVPTAADLSRLIGYSRIPFVVNSCKSWLQTNGSLFSEKGYHVLDMFYWEEKMGNWGAKKRAETNAVGRVIYSPTNSRGLMETCLSVPRKYRDAHHNRLFQKIIRNLANDKVLPEINPFPKTKLIAGFKRSGIYQVYQAVGVKTGMIKF